jgi:peptidoglycan hydrolase CwlO-like protein
MIVTLFRDGAQMNTLKAYFSDPAVIALIVTNVIVAWSLIASHYSTERIARFFTFFAFLPLIALSCWIGYWKIESDAAIQQKQSQIISELETRSSEIRSQLDGTASQIKDIGGQIVDLTPKLANLAKGVTDTLANVKTGNQQRWSHFLRQRAKVDSPMQRTTHHEDAETVFG